MRPSPGHAESRLPDVPERETTGRRLSGSKLGSLMFHFTNESLRAKHWGNAPII
jgi:hypothetical protein